MNAVSQIVAPIDALAKLREPFPDHQISKLPKPTKAQTEQVKADFKKGIRCKLCGSWHHPEVVHLDYVGHAALTDRLLDTDPAWSWEPVAFRDGLPAFDQSGGLWIKLTVCGITRLGYGHAATKQGIDPGSREKEVIGDALRNAAMRFGAALDLWHKGDLHVEASATEESAPVETINEGEWTKLTSLLEATKSDVQRFCVAYKITSVREMPVTSYRRALAQLEQKLAKLKPAETAPAGEFAGVDESDLPY